MRYRAEDLSEPDPAELAAIAALPDDELDFSDIPPLCFTSDSRDISPIEARARFRLLLQRFQNAAAGHDPPSDNPADFRSLLHRFSQLQNRAEVRATAEAASDHKQFASLIVDYRFAWKSHEEAQRERADDFNLLRVLQLTGKEIRHSMALAWLLDHDMQRLGTHAQGTLGFRLFLEACKLPVGYATDRNYWVRREVRGENSIVDIEVGCRGRFLIHVENKIWSSEGMDQTDREWSDLQLRAAALNVPQADTTAIFLTPRGTSPCNLNFRCVSWRTIATILDRFAELAKPPEVQLFARHYARGLRRFIATQNVEEESDADSTDE